MMTWENAVTALIGVWFIMSPFALFYTNHPFMMVTSFIGGAILLIVAGAAVLNGNVRRRAWIYYCNGLVGIWFVVAPSALSFAGSLGDHWTSLVGGIVVLLLNVASLYNLAKAGAAPQAH
jgi:hypothetical protein